MKIIDIRTTPLLCKFKQPYHWAQGVTLGAAVILIEVETDEGITGIGESVAARQSNRSWLSSTTRFPVLSGNRFTMETA